MRQTKNYKIGDFKGIATLDFQVNPKSNFVVTSYWWGKGNINKNSRKSLTYDQLAERLIDDCYRSKCNYCFVEVPEFAVPGGYQKAINYKPTFLKNVIQKIIPLKFNNAVYIDTDMSIRKHPAIFDMIGYDFIGYNWNWVTRDMFEYFPKECWDPYTLNTAGGLMMFTRSAPSQYLLSKWEELVNRYPGKAEDRLLSIPFNNENLITKLRCFWLPVEYFWIPFFYEYSDNFQVEKKFQKYFNGIHFKKDQTLEEINYTDFYDVKRKNLVITHPEMLTSEELASKQGADLNRVPMEWFKSQGRKKKCLTDEEELTFNQNLFLENKTQKSQIKEELKWLKASKFINVIDKSFEIKKKKLEVHSKNFNSNPDVIILSISEGDEDVVEDWKEMMQEYNYLILKKSKTNLPTLIYNVMNKYKKDVIYLNINTKLEKDFKGFRPLDEDDFACLNSNAYPYYSPSLKEKCRDVRFLNCVTTDYLQFNYNLFAKNILKAWNKECKKTLPDSQSLSLAFNKYMLIMNTRVKWLNPGWCYNKKYVTYKKGYSVQISTNKPYPKFKKNVSISDGLRQCGEKRAISVSETPYSTHYTIGKLKKIK